MKMKTIITLTFLSILNYYSIHAQCVSGNCQSGLGTYLLSNGSKYKGDFLNGKFHGLGVLTTASGTTYKAEWKNGSIDGKAIVQDKSGSKMYCTYRNGKREGQAKKYNSSGKLETIYSWKNDALVSKSDPQLSTTSTATQTNKKTSDTQMQSNTASNEDTKFIESIETTKSVAPPVEESPELMESNPATNETVSIDVSPGTMISFNDVIAYNTGDGSLFGNLLGSMLKVKYSVTYYGVVEQKLGDRYKITIIEAQINDPNWASVNYFEYKSQAINDVNRKIGNVVFLTDSEFSIED